LLTPQWNLNYNEKLVSKKKEKNLLGTQTMLSSFGPGFGMRELVFVASDNV
jgi:hypothetical protein